MTKYNRLLAIEEELIQSGTWGTCCFLALFSLSREQGNKDGEGGNKVPRQEGRTIRRLEISADKSRVALATMSIVGLMDYLFT